jgi:phosphatidylserine decarboxylase
VSPAVLMQYLLPHRLLSALAYKLAHSRVRPWKNWLIRAAVAKFRIDVDEAAEPRLEAYPSFNAFFTRALRPDARVADADPATLLQPADGIMSQCGRIEAGRIFQAKGQSFTAAELLGDETMAAPYADGDFANI